MFIEPKGTLCQALYLWGFSGGKRGEFPLSRSSRPSPGDKCLANKHKKWSFQTVANVLEEGTEDCCAGDREQRGKIT